MRVYYVFLCGTFVEVPITLRGFVQADDGDIAVLGRMNLVVQDGLHELTIVTQHGALAGMEGTRLRPSQANADAQGADLCGLVHAAWIAGHVETRNADGATGANQFLERVQNSSGALYGGLLAMAMGFKPHTIDGGIHDRLPQDLGNRVADRRDLAEIHRFAAEGPGLRQTLRDHVANDHDSGAQEMATDGAGETHGAGACDIHRGTRADAGGDSTMKSGRENIR